MNELIQNYPPDKVTEILYKFHTALDAITPIEFLDRIKVFNLLCYNCTYIEMYIVRRWGR